MKKHSVWLILYLFGVLLFSTTIGYTSPQSSNELAVGAGMFTMPESTGATGDDLQIFYYRPANWTPDRPVVIVQHGMNRDAGRYCDEWQQHAKKYNLLVVCPEFSEKKYPGSRYYNTGNVMDGGGAGGKLQPAEKWVFPVLDRVFDQVRAHTGGTRKTFSLYGHSAGAQFVHRYLLLAQQSKADMIISANAGWYTMLDEDIPFPYGIQDISVTDKELTKIFARPVVILLGDQDIDPNHKELRRNAQADRQGINRFERGHSFFEMAKEKATKLGVPFKWQLVVVPGVAHHDAGMSMAAAKLISEQ